MELGALRCEPIYLTEKQKEWLKANTPDDVPIHVAETLLEYYLANKPADSEWCVLPITNIEAYLGSSSLSKSYILLLSGKVLERKAGTSNVCVARFYLPE